MRDDLSDFEVNVPGEQPAGHGGGYNGPYGQGGGYGGPYNDPYYDPYSGPEEQTLPPGEYYAPWNEGNGYDAYDAYDNGDDDGGGRTRKPSAIVLVVIICLILGLAGGGMYLLTRSDGNSDDGTQQEEEEDQSGQSGDAEGEDEDGDGDQDGGSASASAAEAADHVYAHRGTGGTNDDINSMQSAYDQGAVYIEQDVILASDGELYVSKDRLSSEELKSQGKIKLREVFDHFGNRINYVVEIKTRDDDTVDEFIDLVEEYGFEDRVVVQCFETWVLRDIRQQFPHMKTVYLVDNDHGGKQAALDAMDLSYIDEIAVSEADGLMTSSLCSKAHDSGKTFCAWVLDDEDSIREAIDMGLDTYFTRKPELAIRLEQEYRQ